MEPPNSSWASEPDGEIDVVSPEDLERERLITYVRWADVATPWWYWPAYAIVLGGFVAIQDLGPAATIVGVAVLCAYVGLCTRVMGDKGGVFMPRFRTMPAALRRTFLPSAIGALVVGAALLWSMGADRPPSVVLGVITGTVVAVTGAWSGRWYVAEAARLAEREGIVR